MGGCYTDRNGSLLYFWNSAVELVVKTLAFCGIQICIKNIKKICVKKHRYKNNKMFGPHVEQIKKCFTNSYY